MQCDRTQNADSYATPRFIVRAEIRDSVLDLLDNEAESFSGSNDPGARALGITFGGIAENVRDGQSIYYELDYRPYGAPMYQEIMSAIVNALWLQGVQEAGDVDDWRTVADLAAFAADIEEACKRIKADEIVMADARALNVSADELLATQGYSPFAGGKR